MANATSNTINRTRAIAKREVEVLSDDLHSAFDKRLADLRHEIASLTESMQDFGLDAYDGALDVLDDVRHQAGRATRQVGRQANAAGAAIRENPVPTIAILGVIALLTAMVVNRHEH